MSTPYQFPQDDRFRTIAARIADAVTVAINVNHVAVGQSYGTSCPLGCMSSIPRPGAGDAAVAAGCTLNEAASFIGGFDGANRLAIDAEAFFELGRAYRRRFVAGDQ